MFENVIENVTFLKISFLNTPRRERARTRSSDRAERFRFSKKRAECADCLPVAFSRLVDTKPTWAFSHAKRTIREIPCRTRRFAALARPRIALYVSVSFFAKSRRPFLESRTVVFLDGSGVTNSTTRKCFWRMFWRAGSPRRASFYPTHAHARRRYVHARERSAYESLLSPTRVRRTSR